MLVAREAMTLDLLGWRIGSTTLSTMPSPNDEGRDFRAVLCPGGEFILVPLLLGERFAPDAEAGIARVNLRDGRSDIASVTIPRTNLGLPFGGAPDGAAVALTTIRVEGEIDFSTAPPRMPRRYAELHVATFDEAPPREIDVVADVEPFGEADDNPVQWSPDGTRIAWSVAGAFHSGETRIYDAKTGRLVQSVDGTLAGSASWGPAGDRLLITTSPEDTWVHDLVHDTRRSVDAIPPIGTRGMRPLRALGFADDDHLVTVRQRGDRVTVAVLDLTTGESSEVLRYSEIEAHYPVIAAMPPGTWTTPPRPA